MTHTASQFARIVQAPRHLRQPSGKEKCLVIPGTPTQADTPSFEANTRDLDDIRKPTAAATHKSDCGSETFERLFVYGTLMPDGYNFNRIEEFVLGSRPGRIHGSLVDLGSFPALLSGDGVVEGVLLDVRPAALEITDRIEVFRQDKGSSLYIREFVTVVFADGTSTVAWTYLFADPNRIADRPRLVVAHENGTPVHAWRSAHVL